MRATAVSVAHSMSRRLLWSATMLMLVLPQTGCRRPTSPFVGTYHLVDEHRGGAHNLQIKANGTFLWSVEGCDSIGGDNGYWEPTGDGIALRPRGTGWLVRDPSPDFRWEGADGLPTHRVRQLVVRAGADGSVIVSGDLEQAPIEERWIAGEVCAPCASRHAKPGPLVACSRPLPFVVELRPP
jgi:hypothetical protein